MDDPPPKLGPDEVPTREELGRLALSLLRELAETYPAVAEMMRERDIDPEDLAGEPRPTKDEAGFEEIPLEEPRKRPIF
jgi:hypothetical protein